MEPPHRPIFNEAARRRKRQRAAAGFIQHAFLHDRAVDEVVDRLEAILRRFEVAAICGPHAKACRSALPPAANVGRAVTIDDIEGADLLAAPDKLPLADGSVELVVSLMTLHAVNDVPGVLREAHRVLAPDGLFLAVFPGERSLSELREALRRGEAAITGSVAPRIAPFIAVRDGGRLLQQAGFALPVADVDHVQVEYAQSGRLFADLRGTGETSVLRAGPKGALRRDVLAAALAAYQDIAPAPDGREGIVATADLVILTGWKPHPRQQKPLKPGSAKTSLAKLFPQE
ncbi:hypothetical protein PB2503_12909 [Parvularcula bermudensis HTCC2503]|uniref:Methyltransferase type 11 domain-containing protein n=1 Tax=Parvularcula bermudensis (strain ATCC BAA-594 / HTCC2503 / KCTC 12087) TaxID=314260 RepID=E0TG48_PARBH|nr:methyltransferase domain-containing protein [Parvularcula bermudensis]ADM10619.1 hypothetical protein PB2503_12909 [Parvularcula bermudensis HTCC2503]